MKILVLCTANRCRSQMAQGWLRHVLEQAGVDDVQVLSAGIEPRGVHPLAVRVMEEAGVDISHHHSQHVSKLVSQRFHWVITVCDRAADACPAFPDNPGGGPKRIHHPFDDPDQPGLSPQESLALFRQVRDQIRDWAKEFLLVAASSA